jgi:hypothetical protein
VADLKVGTPVFASAEVGVAPVFASVSPSADL